MRKTCTDAGLYVRGCAHFVDEESKVPIGYRAVTGEEQRPLKVPYYLNCYQENSIVYLPTNDHSHFSRWGCAPGTPRRHPRVHYYFNISVVLQQFREHKSNGGCIFTTVQIIVFCGN